MLRRLVPSLAMVVLLLASAASGCATRAQAAQPLTYVAIGASDAVGVGVADPATQGWVPQFASDLGPNVQTINLGVSGSTLHQAMQEQLGPAMDAQPNVVTVWLAVNDLDDRVPLAQYATDLDSLLSSLDQTNARVLVGNIPDLTAVANYAGIPPILLDLEVMRWNITIADVVARHNAQLVDLYADWQEMAQHPEYVSADGFHPSAEGYARLAQLFYQAYQQGPQPAQADG